MTYSEFKIAVEKFLEDNLPEYITCDCSEEESEGSFSWIPCECCKRKEGGNRHKVIGTIAGVKEVSEYLVCVDCYLYLELGYLDDFNEN